MQISLLTTMTYLQQRETSDDAGIPSDATGGLKSHLASRFAVCIECYSSSAQRKDSLQVCLGSRSNPRWSRLDRSRNLPPAARSRHSFVPQRLPQQLQVPVRNFAKARGDADECNRVHGSSVAYNLHQLFEFSVGVQDWPNGRPTNRDPLREDFTLSLQLTSRNYKQNPISQPNVNFGRTPNPGYVKLHRVVSFPGL